MQENIIGGLVLLIIGLFYAIWPNLVLRFQVWIQTTLMGAKYEPSNRTQKWVRSMGIVLSVLGLLVMSGILK